MKKISFPMLFVGLLFLTSSTVPLQKSFKYISAEGKMSVSFPTQYDVKDESSGNSRTVKVSSEDDDRSFLASFTIHEVPLSDYYALAEVSLNSFVEQLNGEITSKSDWDIKGNKGLKANITLEADGMLIEYWVVLRGNIQYQLVAIGPMDSWNQKATDPFFKSFKLR